MTNRVRRSARVRGLGSSTPDPQSFERRPFVIESEPVCTDGGSSTPWQGNDGQAAPRGCAGAGVWLRDLIISLAISAFIIIFLYQPVKVEGTSMMPSLDDQERIFVNKFVYRLGAD